MDTTIKSSDSREAMMKKIVARATQVFYKDSTPSSFPMEGNVVNSNDSIENALRKLGDTLNGFEAGDFGDDAAASIEAGSTPLGRYELTDAKVGQVYFSESTDQMFSFTDDAVLQNTESFRIADGLGDEAAGLVFHYFGNQDGSGDNEFSTEDDLFYVTRPIGRFEIRRRSDELVIAYSDDTSYDYPPGAPGWVMADDQTPITLENHPELDYRKWTTLFSIPEVKNFDLSVPTDADKYLLSDLEPDTNVRFTSEGNGVEKYIGPGGGGFGIKLVTDHIGTSGVSVAGVYAEVENDTPGSTTRPLYRRKDGAQIRHDNGSWYVEPYPFASSATWIFSPEDVATPDLITNWSENSQALETTGEAVSVEKVNEASFLNWVDVVPRYFLTVDRKIGSNISIRNGFGQMITLLPFTVQSIGWFTKSSHFYDNPDGDYIRANITKIDGRLVNSGYSLIRDMNDPQSSGGAITVAALPNVRSLELSF